jgi:hypothetical protein
MMNPNAAGGAGPGQAPNPNIPNPNTASSNNGAESAKEPPKENAKDIK